MPVRGVVFDMDGTLVSQELDFDAIRVEIGIPAGMPLLEAIAFFDDDRKRVADDILEKHERRAAEQAQLYPGVQDFLNYLNSRGIPQALLTRNSRWSAEMVLSRHGLRFHPVWSRDDGPPKPQPHGIWHICATWQIDPADVLMIGDYIHDVEAGRNAGTKTALITHGRNWPFAHLADVTFPNFRELPDGWIDWLEK